MQNIIEKAVRPIDSEAYEILRLIQEYEYCSIILQTETSKIGEINMKIARSTK